MSGLDSFCVVLKDTYYCLLQVHCCYYHYYYYCYYGDVISIVFQGAMQHSKLAAKEEDTQCGRRILRQYCNKRTQKQPETYTTATGGDKVMSQSSVFTVLPAHVKDSGSVLAPEPVKLKSIPDSELPVAQPQVIVRKFTLPSFSSAHALPIRSKKDTNLGRPKQRWKQLCNLQHEMTTTLPVAKVVKMLGPSTPLTREYCPGSLQSYAAGKLDVVNSTLQKLLTVKKVDVDSSTPSGDEGSLSSVSSKKMKSVAVPEDTLGSQIDDVNVEERLDTAEEVPEVAAVAEVSSTGGTVTVAPFDTVDSNVGIVGGKFVIFQPLLRTKHVVQQEAGNSKMNTILLKSPQDATVDTSSGKKVIKPFVGQADVTSSSLKTVFVQGSIKPSSEPGRKQHGIVQENLKHSSEPAMKEQNVVWGNLKHNSVSNIKQHTVVQGNLKHSSEVPKNEENVKLENSKNDTESASKEENVTHDNLKHGPEPRGKEENVLRGNLKHISESASKEKIAAVHPVPQDTNNLKVARDFLRDVLTVSLQAKGIVAPQQDSVQKKNSQSVEPCYKPEEDESAELKRLKQLQLGILMMKRRQNIAMQVEREVLRAKDIKLVQEVQLPARRVLLSETGTQTNLFCLVEPGRMVEMMISGDKTGKYQYMKFYCCLFCACFSVIDILLQ
jgi:hypothetical protein